MRKLIFSLFIIVALGCFAKGPALLEFANTSYDFGTISESSKPVEYEFEFTNIAEEPVAILSASAACGCTSPEYPVKPLRPGEKGVIKVTFKPDGQVGEVNKDIKVRYQRAKATSSKSITLRLKGVVLPKP